MRILFAFFNLFISTAICAQALRTPVSSAFQLVNAYSKEHSDAFSFTYNNAALARFKGFAAGAFAENRFLTDEINHYSSVVGVETDKGNFGFQANYFGFSDFNEYQLGLAYGRSLGENFDIGVQFNYYSYRIPSYPHYGTATFQIGAIARLSSELNVGLQIYNPVGGYLSKINGEKLSSNFEFGAGYEPSENLIISATLQKEEGRNLNVTSGIFYQFQKQFFARAGIRTENNVPFGAAGVLFNDLRIDISVSHHSQLGFSPGVMVIYQPQNIRR